MSQYREVIIETYNPYGEPSSEKVRARPLPGQGLSPNMKVECSSKMREGHPAGTKFKIRAKITDRDGGTNFLYSHYNWPYEVVSDEEASEFISSNYG